MEYIEKNKNLNKKINSKETFDYVISNSNEHLDSISNLDLKGQKEIGIDKDLDSKNEELLESLDKLEAIRDFLNGLIDKKEKDGSKFH